MSTFAEFYALYPRHVGRRAAQKAWEREIKSGTPANLIMDGLRRQIPMLTRRDPQFIPHPATWLNAARWEDEEIAPPPRPTASYQLNAREAAANFTLMLLEGEGDNGHAFDLLDYRH